MATDRTIELSEMSHQKLALLASGLEQERDELLGRALQAETLAEQNDRAAHAWQTQTENLAREQDELVYATEELLDALRGMVGLVQLIDAGNKQNNSTNHRYVTAEEVIAKYRVPA